MLRQLYFLKYQSNKNLNFKMAMKKSSLFHNILEIKVLVKENKNLKNCIDKK